MNAAAEVSRRHPDVARVRRLVRSSTERDAQACFVAEGPRLLEDLVDGGHRPELVLVTPARRAHPAVAAASVARLVDGATLTWVADTRTPQGVVAVFARPEPAPWVGGVDLAVVADGVGDPGNVGTLIRLASAFSAAVGLGDGSADAWSPKAVRAAAGATMDAAPCAGDAAALVDSARAQGLEALGLDADATEVLGPGRTGVVVVGNEARGLSASVRDRCDALVRLPTTGPVESLNAATAAAVALGLARATTGPEPVTGV